MHFKNKDAGSPQGDKGDGSSAVAISRDTETSPSKSGTEISPSECDSASQAPATPAASPGTQRSSGSPTVSSPMQPSLFTTIRAQDIDKRVKQVAGMIPRRLQHNTCHTFLFSMHSLEVQLCKVLECDTPEELLEVRDEINKGKAALTSFTEAAKAAAKLLRTACTQSKKQVEGQASRDQAKAAAQESVSVRKQAEEAKLAVEARAREVPATYKLHNVFPQVAESKSFDDEWDPAKPCLIKKEHVMNLDQLRQEPVVQLMFASFGSSHKQTQTFIDTKMYHAPVRSGKGLEKVNEWISKVPLKPGSPLLKGGVDEEDMQRVTGLPNVMGTRWTFGQCAKERFVTPTRNGFANLRFQASSTVRLIIFLQGKLPQLMGKNIDDVTENIQTLSQDDAAILIQNESVYEVPNQNQQHKTKHEKGAPRTVGYALVAGGVHLPRRDRLWSPQLWPEDPDDHAHAGLHRALC